MGDLLGDFIQSLSPQGIAIGVIVIVIIILGFLIYKFADEGNIKQFEDDETNYEEDRICFNQNRGKVKGMI